LLECKYEECMQTVLDLAPPAGFRKAIPVTVKLEVVIILFTLFVEDVSLFSQFYVVL
jgi:hypothetical protein